MPKIADAFVEIEARTGKYKADIAQAKRITAGFGASATKSLKRVSIGLAAVTAAAAAAAIAIGIKLARAFIRVGTSAVKTAVKFDKLKRGLAAVVGGTKEAAKQLIRLRKVAELPGLSFEAAIQGSVSLQAAGISAQLAERSLSAFGNALVTVSKGVPELKRVNLQLTQLATKTSGFGQELLLLREAVPQVGPALRRAFDNKPIEDLNISGRELVEALVTELEKLPRAAGGIANSIDNIGIEFDLLKAQIGEALLPAVDESLKGLTSIITKLTKVIKHYKDFRNEAATVFRQIAVIGIKLTTELTIGMAKILAKAAKIIWVPLKFEIVKTMQDINDAVEIGVIKMMGKVREFFGGDAEIAKLQIQTVKTSREAWDLLFTQIRDTDFDKAIRENLAAIEKDLKSAFESIMQAFTDANAALDPLVAKLPKVGDGAADVEKTTKAMRNLAGISKEVAAIFAEIRKELDMAFGKRSDALVAKTVAGLEAILKKREEDAAAAKKALKEQQEAAQDLADTIAPAFENLFADLFSGNTKNLWEQFWSDLKRIAIRQIAQIAAAQVLGGFFNVGGKAGGGGGFGDFLSSFAPLLTAVNPALGGLAAAGGFVAGKLEQPRSQQFNFFQTDLADLDPTSLKKTVSQRLLPLIDEEQVDGR